MTRCYDIDHEAETAQSALRAIIARIQGEWDHPDLVEFGPLSTNTLDDVLEIARRAEATFQDSHQGEAQPCAAT